MQPGVVSSWIAVGTASMMRALPSTSTHCGGLGGADQLSASTSPVVSSWAPSTCQPSVFTSMPNGAVCPLAMTLTTSMVCAHDETTKKLPDDDSSVCAHLTTRRHRGRVEHGADTARGAVRPDGEGVNLATWSDEEELPAVS